MIPQGYYIGKNRKLLKKLEKMLRRYKPELDVRYGNRLYPAVHDGAIRHLTGLIANIPYYRAASYREIILVNALLVAIIRAMKDAGKSLEETLAIQTRLFREKFSRIPRIAGRLFVSPIGKFFLKRLAEKVTRESWDTEIVEGGPGDDFDVSVVTKRCGVVDYLKSEGMADLLKYCNMSDFLMFPAMNIGLRQPSTIPDGPCVYCMKYGAGTDIPETLASIYNLHPSTVSAE